MEFLEFSKKKALGSIESVFGVCVVPFLLSRDCIFLNF